MTTATRRAAGLGALPADLPHAPPAGHPCSDVPVLASGVTLIGEYEASGYTEAPCLVRRSDGQTIQLTPLLYATLEQIDGQRDAAPSPKPSASASAER